MGGACRLSGLLATILLVGACAPADLASPSTLVAAPSDAPAPSQASAAAPSASPEAEVEPSWATALARQLDCDGAPAKLGAAVDPDDVNGVPVADAADGALVGFLDREAVWYGFLPLDGWTIVSELQHWQLAAHLVGGRAKAVASFSDQGPEGEGIWVVWQVAACDASEFADDVPVSSDLVRWTDGSGRFVPTTILREAMLCIREQRRLRVDGREFLRDPTGTFPPDRRLGSFETGVELPADAKATPYRDGDRRLWIADDGSAAYVGMPDALERWPRVVDDDASVTDCN